MNEGYEGNYIMESMNRVSSHTHVRDDMSAGKSLSSALHDRISLLLTRWTGLQLAIQNQWGGHDSSQKYQKLAADIFSWFSQSKGTLHVEDLENLLHESMLLSFNTDVDDGSIEEIAEQLMIIHEEDLQETH